MPRAAFDKSGDKARFATAARWRCALMAASAMLAGAQSAFAASEPTSELPAGGLVYAGQQTLVTEREDITIGPRAVSVSYVIRNTGDEARTALMAFPLPDIDMLALDGAAVVFPATDLQNAVNFASVSAQVDGLPAALAVETRALTLGLLDVTQRLQALGLPLSPLHAETTDRLAALPAAAQAELAARGVVRTGDGQIEPLWHLKTTFHWQT